MRKEFESMLRKELVQLASIYHIKNRHKLSKSELISAIKKAKKPLKDIKSIEEKVLKELPKKYNINHLEFAPKEPGYAFVNWETNEAQNPTLKIHDGRKELLSLPVRSSGKGYFKVTEGSKLKATLGVYKGNRFKGIVSSSEIYFPLSSPLTHGEVEWVNSKEKSKKHKKVKETKEMLKEKEKIEKAAKKIKYLRFPKEDK